MLQQAPPHLPIDNMAYPPTHGQPQQLQPSDFQNFENPQANLHVNNQN